jgi:hypothetical protein
VSRNSMCPADPADRPRSEAEYGFAAGVAFGPAEGAWLAIAVDVSHVVTTASRTR